MDSDLLQCEFKYSNDLSMITTCNEVYDASSSELLYLNYSYSQVPFYGFLVIAIPFMWVAGRIIIEFIKRWIKS